MESQSSSPQKSTRSEDISKSSQTTSVPDISSLSSLSSVSKNEIALLRKRVQVLKIQLREKDLELDRQIGEKEVEKEKGAELNFFKLKSEAMSKLCDEMSTWMETAEREEERRCTQIDVVYHKHILQANEVAKRVKDENGRLNAQLRANQTKMSSIIHENGFLRWENESLRKETNQRQALVDAEQARLTALKADISALKTMHAKCEEVEKREMKLVSCVEKSTTTIQKMKRIQQDREKEYGITLTRMQNEMDYVNEELRRKDEVAKTFVDIIDKLTMDNASLQNRLQEREIEVVQFASRLPTTTASSHSFPSLSPPEAMRREERRDGMEERLIRLTRDCQQERQWRRDLSLIHVEMTKDMRRLLQLARPR